MNSFARLSKRQIVGTVMLAFVTGQIPSSWAVTAGMIIPDPNQNHGRYAKEFPQFCSKDTRPIFNHTLYVSPDTITPRVVTFHHDRSETYLMPAKYTFHAVFELPDGLSVTGMAGKSSVYLRDLARPAVEEFSREGQPWHRYRLVPTYVINQPGGEGTHLVYFQTTLPAGTVAEGRYYLTWDVGQQAPQTIRIESIAIPPVRPPKRIMTGIYELNELHTSALCPKFPADFTKLGLNTLGLSYLGHLTEEKDFRELRFIDPMVKAVHENGLYMGYVPFFPYYPGHDAHFHTWMKNNPDACAVGMDGKPVFFRGVPSMPLLCPSYRGSNYQDAIARLETSGQIRRQRATLYNWDLEIYGGEGRDICFCKRCVGLFEKWFKKNHPDLKYIDPVTLNRNVRRPAVEAKSGQIVAQYPKQFDAWIDFKIEMYADFIAGFKRAIAGILEGTHAQTAPLPGIVFIDWSAIYKDRFKQENCLIGPPTHGKAIDLFTIGAYSPPAVPRTFFPEYMEYYYKQLGIRHSICDTPPASAIASCGLTQSPVYMKYSLLESAISGLQGLFVYYFSAVEGKQLQMMSQVFGALALVDDIIADGDRLDNLQGRGQWVSARGLQLKDEKVILVGDNYVDWIPRDATLVCPVRAKTPVYDLFQKKQIGVLTPERPVVTFKLTGSEHRAEFLYVGSHWQQRMDAAAK